MDIMLEKILELLENEHGSSQKLVRAIGATKNAVTEWKSGRSKSYTKYAPQIAEYFGVSLDWLTGLSDQKEKPAPTIEDGLSDDIKFLLSMYHSVPLDKRAEALAKIANDLKKAGLIE